ncbi:MAG: helix-turn-helix domain-containing protein [Lachnospiraceae bacterium]|nr:helix-turn-helix domain-containing protein [Lachnospiraceae bacterium]
MNILIVDDDRFVVAALEKNIDWESLGITGVYSAYDIQGAQSILSSKHIDLLLSDIDMPHGSGLDLLGIIREQGNGMPAIFLTNYADFDYARRALELRSFHYFLKPIDYDELTGIIRNALLEVSGDLSVSGGGEAAAKLWYDYLIGGRITYKAFVADLERVCPFGSEGRENFTEPSYVVSLLQFGNPGAGEDRGIMASGVRTMAESIFGPDFASFGVMLPYQSEDFILYALIPVFDEESYGAALRPLISELYYSVKEKYGSMQRIFVSSAKKIQDIPDVLENLIGMRVMPLDENQTVVYIDETSVTALLQYVDAHYTEDISRESLSEMFFFSPDYLTKIFKKETGNSFKNYIIYKRLELAKKLLKNTDLPIRDISLQVGYDNYSYFTRLFKKATGTTPVEYRG